MRNKIKKVNGSLENIGIGIVLIILWIISGAKFAFSLNAEALGFNLFNLLLVGGGVYFIIKGFKQKKASKKMVENGGKLEENKDQ